MLKPEEIAEERTVTGIQVLTPGGFRNIVKVYKSIPLPVWKIQTTNYTLKCAHQHLVYSEKGLVAANTLLPHDRVQTEKGLEEIILSENTGNVEELYDITVDDPAGLFYSDGILSHNSTTIALKLIMSMVLIPRYQALYIAPYSQQADTFAARLQDLEALCRVGFGIQNKKAKLYANGARLDIMHALTDSQQIRGKSKDIVILDECQNMDPDIFPEVLYTQAMSKLPINVYTGTALGIDSMLEAKWQESSQGRWMQKLGDGSYVNMYDKETLYAICDHPDGPRCPKTGKLLNVLDGFYEHANQKSFLLGNIGYHVPQCIITDVAYNPIQWTNLYQHLHKDGENTIMQECFGIAVAEGTREITQQDLMRMCVLPDTEEQLQNKCKTGYYRTVISGCDWGGSDYNPQTKTKTSYTVHCIMGVAPDDRIDILYYRRYSGMDYPEIAASILAAHKAFNGKLMASDFGVGMAYNMEIRKGIPFDHHFIMNYNSAAKEAISEPSGPHLQNQLTLNRTEALTNVFAAVRDPNGKIRCRGWEYMETYLRDWLAMYRVPSEGNTGASTFKYIRAATKPDDALHAFTFGYVLAMYFMGVPLVKDPALDARMRAVIYQPSRVSELKGIRRDPFDDNGGIYSISG